MSVHIVIDGYNLIRQSPTLSAIEHRSLEEGREALLQRLVSYKKVSFLVLGSWLTVLLNAWSPRNGSGPLW
jgi:predicted RNA-binding protein with PIN domain